MRRSQDDFGAGEPVAGLVGPMGAPTALPTRRSFSGRWLLAGGAVLLGLIAYDARRSWIVDDPETGFAAPERVVAAPPVVSPARAPATGLATDRKADECGGSPAALPITPPRPIGNMGMWVTPEDYPVSSLRANEEGVSALILGVDSRGRIAQCQVVGASGHVALDTAACAALQARGQYHPAQDARGCPVPYRLSQRVRWSIPIG